MKKMITLALMLLGCMIPALATATPVWYAGSSRIDAKIVEKNGEKFLRYQVVYEDLRDMWPVYARNFCADARREGCSTTTAIPFAGNDGNTRYWDVPFQVIEWGQSGVNFAKDGTTLDSLWVGLPDSKMKVGPNLVCARSVQNSDIPYSGGTYLLYVGPGAPYVPASGELGNDGRPVVFPCPGNVAAAAPAPRPVARPAAVPPKGEMSQIAVKSPDAQQVQTKQVAKVKVTVKGNNNTTTTTTKQQKNVTAQKGATVKVKGNKNNINACTYNINYTVQGVDSSIITNECNGCHNKGAWKYLEKGKKSVYGNHTSSCVKKEVTKTQTQEKKTEQHPPAKRK